MTTERYLFGVVTTGGDNGEQPWGEPGAADVVPHLPPASAMSHAAVPSAASPAQPAASPFAAPVVPAVPAFPAPTAATRTGASIVATTAPAQPAPSSFEEIRAVHAATTLQLRRRRRTSHGGRILALLATATAMGVAGILLGAFVF